MEKERGIVHQVIGQKAVIRVQKSSSCATCAARDQCEMLSDRDILIEVMNDLCVREGDQVEICVPTRSLLKLSLLVYLLPILLMIAGAFTAGEWADASHRDPALPSVLGGMGAMIFSFLVLKWFDHKLKGKREYIPRMVRIFSNVNSPQCDGSK